MSLTLEQKQKLDLELFDMQFVDSMYNITSGQSTSGRGAAVSFLLMGLVVPGALLLPEALKIPVGGLLVAASAVAWWLGWRERKMRHEAEERDWRIRKMEGLADTLDGVCLSHEHYVENVARPWLESNLNPRELETALGIAAEFQGTVRELVETAKALESDD